MGFITHIKEEFQVIQERDPAIKTPLEVLLYPSFRVMIQYRKAHKLYCLLYTSGANGEGKSTFMNIITGKLMPDEGKIEWAKNVRVGYLDQHTVLEKGMTIRDVQMCIRDRSACAI